MYCILDTPTEASPVFYQAINAEIVKAIDFLQGSGSTTERHDQGPAMICLTETTASWISAGAYELRWTSLAA